MLYAFYLLLQYRITPRAIFPKTTLHMPTAFRTGDPLGLDWDTLLRKGKSGIVGLDLVRLCPFHTSKLVSVCEFCYHIRSRPPSQVQRGRFLRERVALRSFPKNE